MSTETPAFPPAPIVERPRVPGLLPRAALWMLRGVGWHVRLLEPVPMRCVAIFYPHTSNWDTIFGLLAKMVIGLRIHFVGKDTLFRWPLKPLLVWWGGIPVNRREPQGFAGEIEREFARRDEFLLAMAPEGTRSRTEYWKSGFYRIARAAGVPLALAYIDFPEREIGVGAYVDLTGDVAADMARIRAFYADKRGRHPENQGPIRLHDED
ncbi:MAG: lysophospholipid acyltransferase family protein [Casimicrobiaceae bacterium]